MSNTINSLYEIMGVNSNTETTTKATAGEPTQAMIDYYVKLCTMKGVEQQPVEIFNFITLKVEIEKLKMLRNKMLATQPQKNLISANLALAGITKEDLDTISLDDASSLIQKINKSLPVTQNQADRILDFYRLGIIPMIPKNLNKETASSMINSYYDSYKEIRVGKATLNQVKFIMSLQSSVRDNVCDIRELSLLTIEQAGDLIEVLQNELKMFKERINMKTVDQEAIDSESRSRETELLKTFEDFKVAEQRKLYNRIHKEILGTQAEKTYSKENFIELVVFVESFDRASLEALLEE